MRTRRSTIVVPGNAEETVLKSQNYESDSLMLDLGDSVPPTDRAKTDARWNIGAALTRSRFRAHEVMVRLNPPRTRWFRDDIEWLISNPVQTVVVPRVYSNREFSFVENLLDDVGIDAAVRVQLIVETPGCLLELEAIVQDSRRIDSIVSGGWGYTFECGSPAIARPAGSRSPLHQAHLDFLRQKVIAVGAASRIATIDGLLSADVKDHDEAWQAATSAKLAGFDGCLVLYPPHIAICNSVFAPSNSCLDMVRSRRKSESGHETLTI